MPITLIVLTIFFHTNFTFATNRRHCDLQAWA